MAKTGRRQSFIQLFLILSLCLGCELSMVSDTKNDTTFSGNDVLLHKACGPNQFWNHDLEKCDSCKMLCYYVGKKCEKYCPDFYQDPQNTTENGTRTLEDGDSQTKEYDDQKSPLIISIVTSVSITGVLLTCVVCCIYRRKQKRKNKHIPTKGPIKQCSETTDERVNRTDEEPFIGNTGPID